MSLATVAIDLLFRGAGSAEEVAAAEALNHRGMTRFRAGSLDSALSDFQEATRRDPSYAEAWNNCGMVELMRGRPAEARDAFTRALALAPEYAEALNNRGRARQALEDFDGAMADFEEALACAKGLFLATVHHNCGTLCQARGDLSRALADFDKALKVDPGHVASYVNRGIARKDAGDIQGALADFDRAMTATSTRHAAPIYHARGGLRVLLNDFVGAIADYDEALRLEPGFIAAHISRGNACYHRRDPRGIAAYRTAFRIDPERAAREVVRMLREGVRRGAADVLANCDQHLRISDRDVLAHARRGLTLVLLGQEEQAAPHLTRFREMVPDSAIHLDRMIELARASRAASRERQEAPVKIS